MLFGFVPFEFEKFDYMSSVELLLLMEWILHYKISLFLPILTHKLKLHTVSVHLSSDNNNTTLSLAQGHSLLLHAEH
jgi:hypothetical protein